MAKLRTELLAIRNALQSIANEDEDSQILELEDVIENLNTIIVNSKTDSFKAFDSIEKAEQFIVITTKPKSDSVNAFGDYTDVFEAELAFNLLSRVRKYLGEKAVYTLFLKMMGGAYDND